MSTPSIVVFDLGKVLVDFDYSIAARKVAAHSARAVEHLRSFLESSPLLVQYETGRLTRGEFFAEICRATGFQGTLAEFGEFFADIFTAIPPMIELHQIGRASCRERV